MTPTLIGYARCSTTTQDLEAQFVALRGLGVAEDRIYLDKGMSGANRQRAGLAQALAAVREGDTFVVTKLDRLGRSVPDLRDIADSLVARGVKLSIGSTIHDPRDPVGKLLFTALSMVAEFELDIIRARTREGMAVARAKGRLRGKQPKLSAKQQAHLMKLWLAGEHSILELAELFQVARATVYRTIERNQSAEALAARARVEQSAAEAAS